MKRTTGVCAAALLVLMATVGHASDVQHSGHDMHMGHDTHAVHGVGGHMDVAGARKTVTGEVVDMGCYLGHGARGEKHMSCATKCINQGMPMGLLTSTGALYLITMNHDNVDPYNDLKAMAGKTVSVTGTVMTRSGMQGIDVTEYKAAAKTARR